MDEKDKLLTLVYLGISEHPEWFVDLVKTAASAQQSYSEDQKLKMSKYYDAMVNALALASEKRLSKEMKEFLNNSLITFFKESKGHCGLIQNYVKENDKL